MTTLIVEIDAARPLALLRNGGRRMAYAVVNTLNGAAKEVQAATRAEVRRRLTLRKPEFVLRQAAIIDPFASVPGQRYHARVRIGQKERLLLTTLETGGTRPSFGGGKRVAVPRTGGAARPAFTGPVPTEMRVTRLRLIKVRAGAVQRSRGGRARRERATVSLAAHTTNTGKVQIKGARRTFVLDKTARAPEGGIYQRVGPGRDDIRLIYPFVRAPRLKQMTRWLAEAKRTANAALPRLMRQNVNQELVRAFGIGR